jgi:hypothetical protein
VSSTIISTPKHSTNRASQRWRFCVEFAVISSPSGMLVSIDSKPNNHYIFTTPS